MDIESRLRIREATPGDAPALVALIVGGALVVGREADDGADLTDYTDALAEIAETPGNVVLVAELVPAPGGDAGATIVGTCQLITFRHLQRRGGRCAEIESMHVDAARRSEGIGAALLAAAVERARAAGCYRVQLTSDKARADAHRFYLRAGFEASHEGFKLML